MSFFSLNSAVKKGALLLAVSSILSRALGVARDMVFSRIFGVGAEGGIFSLDAYFLAFRIPDFIYTLLIMGAVGAVFVPLYTELKMKDPNNASNFASSVLNAVGLLLIVVSVLLFFLMPYLIPLLAPGFSFELQDLAINLSRLMLVSPLLLGLSSVLQSIENVSKRFLGMALAPLVYNASVLAAALIGGARWGVYALAVGVVIGALLHFLVQVPGALRTSFSYRLTLLSSLRELKTFALLALPRIFGSSAAQIALLVDTVLASLLPLGAVSVYTYALNLQSFPYGVIGVSLALAVFPHLSETFARKHTDQFFSHFKSAFQGIWYWALPVTVGLFFVSHELIQLLLEGGAFDAAATERTLKVFQIFVWSAIPLSLTPLLTRAFYAMSNTKTPFIIGVITMCLQISLSVILTRVYSFSIQGLALSNLLASSLQLILLFLALKKSFKFSVLQMLPFRSVLISVFGCAVMSAVLYFTIPFIPKTDWLRLILMTGLGAGSYFGVTTILGFPPVWFSRRKIIQS